MAYTGTGTEADPYLVDNITDFCTCVNISTGAFVKLTADIDCTNAPITGTGEIIILGDVTIDGDGHSLNNLTKIVTNIDRNGGYSIFNIPNNNYQDSVAIFKNININILYVFNNYADQNSHVYLFRAGYYRNNASFDNCDIKIKMYLSNLQPSSSYFSTLSDIFFDTNNTKAILRNCNFLMDIYLITASNLINSIVAGNFYDSIIKINIYDPMGWGKKLTGIFTKETGQYGYSGAIDGSTIDNCGVFITYNADIDMVTDNEYISIIARSTIVNSYFIYENVGNVSITPFIYSTYFLTYAFYDITKAPNLIKNRCTYHFDSSQFMGLTTNQCKTRSTFEGPTAVLPFKLKQSVEP